MEVFFDDFAQDFTQVFAQENKILAIKRRLLALLKTWWRGLDLNQRPSGYGPDELPGCSTPRHMGIISYF